MKKRILIITLLMLMNFGISQAADIYVNADATGDYPTIQAAINAANPGDIVIVNDGIYTGDGNRDLDYGGKALTVRSANGPANCIIDCQATPTDTHRGFYFNNNESSYAVVDGFTIINGNSQADILYKGGGIYCRHSSPTIKNCIIKDNYAEHDGGGIAFLDSTSRVINCLIIDNTSNRWGGGLFSSNLSNIEVINCTVAGNHSASQGGGFCCYGSNNTLTNSILWNNSSDMAGQEIEVRHAPSTLTVQYSDVQGGADDVDVETGSALTWALGNIDTDPLFVDAANGNYHLQLSSPCINSGDPAFTPEPGQVDVDGQTRVMAGRVDMGIDEVLLSVPFVDIWPEEFEFWAYIDGPNPDSKILTIRNVGAGMMNWQITDNCDWLEEAPDSGSSTDETNDITLSVDQFGLGVGDYTCQLTISAPEAANSPLIVPVNLNVREFRYVPSDYFTIQDAINAANPGDMVIVNDGTYTGDGNRDLDFHGKAITVRSANGPANCIIDCQATPVDPHRGFYFHNNETEYSVLTGFTITGGYASFGGAMLCQSSSPKIVNCVFEDNSCSAAGGGIENEDNSNPTLINCIFRNNSAPNFVAGALRNHTSSPLLINCLFTGNSAIFGGAIQNENNSSNPTLINCTFTGNTATSRGGGIINAGSSLAASPVLTNCIFWANNDQGGTDQSAQIYEGTPIVNYSCIQGWTGSLGGTGNIGDNPMFDSTNDYHLTSRSPCIDTGDPLGHYSDQIDIDGQPRIIHGRVDIGVDEYYSPLADAGPDQTFNQIPTSVILDASGSYFDDLQAIKEYLWTQISGPVVQLLDADTEQPSFVPLAYGIYVFELVVNNGLLDSRPDTVAIVVSDIHAPIADAGLSRYAATDPVVLDGTKSYDPDGDSQLYYQWQQVSGPAVVITDADTPTPTISGFTQADSIQACEFQLIVSDGQSDSFPDIVEVIIVPDYGENTMELENDFFDPNKPTMIYFNGGNCNSGGGGYWRSGVNWEDEANIMMCSYYAPDSNGYYPRTYYKYGDMLIVYLSKVAPNYNMPIQSMGLSTGGMPAIDIGIQINTAYKDRRYAINRITFLDVSCIVYSTRINTFLRSRVDGEQCWIDNYYSSYYGRILGNPDILTVNFMAGGANDHFLAERWFQSSFLGTDMNSFNGGVIAGTYWSVIGPGKNLQLASALDMEIYKFKWLGSRWSGYMNFLDESLYPGTLPEPVTLIKPDAVMNPSDAAVLTCRQSENAVGYQLLVGSDPYRVMDFQIISDTTYTPTATYTQSQLPQDAKYWTIKASDQWGSTIYADPFSLPWFVITVPDDAANIQNAINMAFDGGTIIVSDGTYTGSGNRDLDFHGKAITLRSANGPANCIIDCQSTPADQHRGFYFHNNETADSVLSGFTITGGYTSFGGAILCQNSSPKIVNCVFEDNSCSSGGGGIENEDNSNPTLINCIFRRNSAPNFVAGALRNHTSSPLLINCLFTDNSALYGGAIQNENNTSNPTLINCTFTGNTATHWGGGIINAGPSPAASPVLTNCIFWGNNDGGGTDQSAQIHGGTPIINNSCIQGWTGSLGGTNNIGDNPMFVSTNDYHLQPASPCIDAATDAGVYEDMQGNTRPWDYPGVDNNGSEPDFDMGAYEFTAMEFPLKITPQTLNCNSNGNWVKAHFDIPPDLTIDDVDTDTPAIIEPLGIASEDIKTSMAPKGLAQIKISFDRTDFCQAATGFGPKEFTVFARLTDGQYYFGTDTIRIIDDPLAFIISLTEHWLRIDCAPPNWCDSSDLNQDSVVNLEDFALYDN